jgi:hypothetical protein
MRGQAPNSMGTTRYRVGASAPSAIGLGDPVARTAAGGIAPATAVGDLVLGGAAGFSWVDPTTKLPMWAGNIAAGTSSADQNIWVDVYDGDNHTFLVQADASCSYGDIGMNFPLSGVGSPNAITGISQAILKVTSRTSGLNAAYAIVGFSGRADNALTDAFPICEVRIKAHDDTKVSAF